MGINLMKINQESMMDYPTSKFLRGVEAFTEILLKLLVGLATYYAFNWVGKNMFDSDFSSETLFSLLLLPALYILKTADEIICPALVKVRMSNNKVESRKGIFTQRLDKLELSTVENIEVVSTLGGRYFNYGTIYLYAHGSWVELPFLMNPNEVKKELERKIMIVRKNNSNSK
jgi:Bacterial PH domain